MTRLDSITLVKKFKMRKLSLILIGLAVLVISCEATYGNDNNTEYYYDYDDVIDLTGDNTKLDPLNKTRPPPPKEKKFYDYGYEDTGSYGGVSNVTENQTMSIYGENGNGNGSLFF